MTAAEYRQALDALPYGKRLPGAVYLVDPGDEASIPSLLRVTVGELRKRLEFGFEFNLLKFHNQGDSQVESQGKSPQVTGGVVFEARSKKRNATLKRGVGSEILSLTGNAKLLGTNHHKQSLFAISHLGDPQEMPIITP